MEVDELIASLERLKSLLFDLSVAYRTGHQLALGQGQQDDPKFSRLAQDNAHHVVLVCQLLADVRRMHHDGH